mgnify:CR=1 FL=1
MWKRRVQPAAATPINYLLVVPLRYFVPKAEVIIIGSSWQYALHLVVPHRWRVHVVRNGPLRDVLLKRRVAK